MAAAAVRDQVSEPSEVVREAPSVSPLTALEQQLRGLMRELGEARFALDEAQRSHRERTRARLIGLVGAVDAFDRILQSMAAKTAAMDANTEGWFRNLRTARTVLERALQDEGLIRMAPEPGEAFDPHWHRVSGTVSSTEYAEGAIVEIHAPGWLWDGSALSKSAVIVAQGGEPARAQPEGGSSTEPIEIDEPR